MRYSFLIGIRSPHYGSEISKMEVIGFVCVLEYSGQN